MIFTILHRTLLLFVTICAWIVAPMVFLSVLLFVILITILIESYKRTRSLGNGIKNKITKKKQGVKNEPNLL